MKNLLSLTLSILMIITLLTSCADTGTTYTPSTDDYDSTDITLPEKKNVTYPVVYTVLDEIEYDTTNVLGTAQIEDKLYLLEPNGVHMVNLADGTISLVFEKEGLMFIASHETELYVTDTISVYTLDPSSVLINTQQIPEGAFDKANLEYNTAFISTDDYFVFACMLNKKNSHVYISKADMSVTINSKSYNYIICPYEGNKYWILNLSDYSFNSIISYDIDAGKKVNELTIIERAYAMAYDKYSGNIILCSSSLNGFGIKLLEFNPEDLTNKQIALYSRSDENNYIDGYITAYGNIYCSISTCFDGIKIHDVKKEVKTINIAAMVNAPAEAEYLSIILGEKYDIQVNVSLYTYQNRDMLPLKLMAGDKDIDIFYGTDNTAYYVASDCFVDLNQFEVLKDNISTCENLLKYGFTHNDQIFGIPFVSGGSIIDDCSQLNGTGDHASADNITAYCAKYFDLVNKNYSDDGDVLYDLLKHNFDNRSDNPLENMTDRVVIESLCKDVTVITSECYMMNPASENKEEAAVFLNELMNFALGRTYDDVAVYSDIAFSRASYYDLSIDYSTCYPYWKADGFEVRTTLGEAVTAARDAEKLSEVKTLAKEYYNRLRQIIQE